jgi:hypothetical protein
MKKFLEKFDGLWALPLAFALFIFAGYALQELGGLGTGSYDIAFIQPLFLATAVVIGATNAAVWGLYFTFRDVHKWLYGQRGRSEFRTMDKYTKTIISLTVFFLFFFAIISIFKTLV